MKKRNPIQLDFEPAIFGLVAQSAAMRETLQLAQAAARCRLPVLISGEPGTELHAIAKLIHGLDRQQDAANFVCLGADVGMSLESAVTDSSPHQLAARSIRSPIVERLAQADGATLVIDEIDRLSEMDQRHLAKWLAVNFSNQGADVATLRDETANIQPRVIACSRVDLTKLVAGEKFREDLFWQLAVLPIAIPPLRRRREDIPDLVTMILRAINGPLQKVEPQALDMLCEYNWPGNLDELVNYLRRANALAPTHVLTAELLPSAVTGESQLAGTAVFRPADNPSLIREFVFNSISNADKHASNLYELIVQPVEKELLAQVMQTCQNVQTRAAQRLGMNRNTLYKKLKDYGLDKEDAESTVDQPS